MNVIGISLVRNEDVFVEQALRNVTRFCDVIHVVDGGIPDLLSAGATAS